MKRSDCRMHTAALALTVGLTFVAATSSADDASAAASEDLRDPGQVEAAILSVLDAAVDAAAHQSDKDQIRDLKAQVAAMTDDELLSTFNDAFMRSFSMFEGVLQNLQTLQSEEGPTRPDSSGAPSTLATGVTLRNASYSAICGSTRANTDVVVIALGVFLLAEAVKEAAISGCGTVVVVGGFGGSPQSAVCSGVVAGVFQIARGVWEEFLLCQDSIDSAEILGAYQRAEDVFNSLNEHDTDLKTALGLHDAAIKADLSQHDTEIKAKVDQHDLDIKMRLDQLGGKLDHITELLLTPQGRRPGWNEQQ